VPPLFGKNTFTGLANTYGGGRSFRDTTQRLDEAARTIADAHLHEQICRTESLSSPQQVNFAAEIDVLFVEIVRIAPWLKPQYTEDARINRPEDSNL
jgi:hypothetical protein